MSHQSNQHIPWPTFFKHIKRTIKTFPTPYVTVLARQLKDQKQLPYAVLLSTIISLRTKDKVTEEATERLLQLAQNPQDMSKKRVSQIEKAIYPAGFFRNKAKSIKEISKILIQRYKGNVPDTLEQLVELPGVGRKTANLVLTEGFDTYGICVDIHVHRILNRVGLVQTKNPDETEMVLREILPKRYWKPINFWLVTFGQHHCKPVGPKCGECLLRGNCTFGKECSKSPKA